MLIHHPEGGYGFLPAIQPYSSGVIAGPEWEIVHVRFRTSMPWCGGFGRIDAVLSAVNRPRTALCAIGLRCPVPHPMAGFISFNDDYFEVLTSWGVLVDGQNPVARTNVAPVSDAPAETHLYSFSYTRPRTVDATPSFVVSGAGELHSSELVSEAIIRRGETSADALHEKATYVMGVMTRRLEGLGVGWDDVTCVNVYTAHPVDALVEKVVAPAGRPAGRNGITLHHTRPPIEEIEFEMDVRGVQTEHLLE